MKAHLVVPFLLLSSFSLADERKIYLTDAPNKDLVEANCSTCHSLDYIQMNSVFMDRKGWDGTVTKMMKVMGAPILPDVVPRIIDYLAKNYGK